MGWVGETERVGGEMHTQYAIGVRGERVRGCTTRCLQMDVRTAKRSSHVYF